MSVHSHPINPFSLATGLARLYDARSFNIKPFSERAKAVLNDTHLSNTNIQENNILAFPPWDIQIFNYSNPFSGYDKAGTADVIYQQLYSFHRTKLGSCAKKINNQSIKHASAVVYSFVGYQTTWDIVVQSATTELRITVPLCETKRVIQHRIDNAWRESWNLQNNKKWHCVKPVIGDLLVMPMRRTNVKLTRIHFGHNRFTHRHVLLVSVTCPVCLENKSSTYQLSVLTYMARTLHPAVSPTVSMILASFSTANTHHD
ncbi:RNase H domain-containing protein [Trichonephila clavipes]|nr:RNase H domain-containing protein [Trichonephila clavipes]